MTRRRGGLSNRPFWLSRQIVVGVHSFWPFAEARSAYQIAFSASKLCAPVMFATSGAQLHGRSNHDSLRHPRYSLIAAPAGRLESIAP